MLTVGVKHNEWLPVDEAQKKLSFEVIRVTKRLCDTSV
jgi:hypothetical protein